MIITSPLFEEGEFIPRKFSWDSGNINPELLLQNVPIEAKTLALILHDPDAPIAGGFTHWIVWNIKPTTTLIKEESVPPGSTEGTNDAGIIGYVGPKPPSGTHRYNFQLYALDIAIDLPETARVADLQKSMDGHVIARADLTGLYKMVD